MVARMLARSSVAIAVAILLGCQSSKARPGNVHMDLKQTLIAEFRSEGESIFFEVDDQNRIYQIESWVAEISRRQPEHATLGAVLPWCVLSVFDDSPRGATKWVWVRQVHLYSRKSAGDPRELVTAQEEKELLILLDAEHFAGRFNR